MSVSAVQNDGLVRDVESGVGDGLPSPKVGSVTKHGNRRLWADLVELAWRMVRFQPQYHPVQNRLKGSTPGLSAERSRSSPASQSHTSPRANRRSRCEPIGTRWKSALTLFLTGWTGLASQSVSSHPAPELAQELCDFRVLFDGPPLFAGELGHPAVVGEKGLVAGRVERIVSGHKVRQLDGEWQISQQEAAGAIGRKAVVRMLPVPQCRSLESQADEIE